MNFGEIKTVLKKRMKIKIAQMKTRLEILSERK